MNETHYQLLKALEGSPDLSQRDLAERLGISVGKVNYCLKALMNRGLVKMKNFSKSKHKFGYAYVLTPSGLKTKAELALDFLSRKRAEYEHLQKEISELEKEVKRNGPCAHS